MKNIISISILLCALFFSIGCESIEENTDPLIGSWDMTQLTGGFVGANETYNPGEIVWTFSEDSLSIQGSSMFVSEGTSRYLLVEHGDSLFIDTYYNAASPASPFLSYLEINDDEMTIDQNIILFINDNDTIQGTGNDGFFFSFEKQ